MALSQTAQSFVDLDTREPVSEYNYEHFDIQHLLKDALRMVTGRGVPPGEPAPDFDLPRLEGGSLRLSDLRDRPVLLHFGSFT